MTREANPALITLARESRGMTQARLAERMGVSQSKLSKLETGILQPTTDDLAALSEATDYTVDFFEQDAEVQGFLTPCIFHRKKASMPMGALRVLHAKLNIFRMQAPRLLEDIEVGTDRSVPRLDPNDFGGPAGVAQEVRRIWGLPMGPLRNLTAALERAGILVRKATFGTARIDALSQLGQRLVFIANADAPGDRLRFSLAHELGHVIMHGDATPPDVREPEANEFASAFLMPGPEIGPDLRRLTLDRLPALKMQWRVSMQALIRRAVDLDRITERHYTTLMTQMSKNGWRLREPVEIAIEEPTVMRNVLRVHVQEHGYGLFDLSRMAYLTNPAEFSREFGIGEEPKGLRIVG